MLYGKILRSRYPHARILSIDTSRAEELEGVFAVIIAKDTPKIKFGFMKDNLPLKDNFVLSYRDEIAAVAAIDEATAARALELIEVEDERLPAFFDPLEAMKPSSRHSMKMQRKTLQRYLSISGRAILRQSSKGKTSS